jgi:hypothetical protein
VILKDLSKEDIEKQIELLKGQGEEAKLPLELCEKWLAAMEISGEFVEVQELDETSRGDGGFGHTGTI